MPDRICAGCKWWEIDEDGEPRVRSGELRRVDAEGDCPKLGSKLNLPDDVWCPTPGDFGCNLWEPPAQ